MKDNNTFNETYIVRATYQKNDGFWTKTETKINVPVVYGVNEKNNHQKAGELFLKQNKELKNLEIYSIIYV